MKNQKGFTLIELLVVIAIIGIMSAVVLASFSAAKSRSRDVKRISDLSNIQLALAGYFNRCGDYPTMASTSAGYPSDTGCPSGITLGTYISSIPTDPTNSSQYIYTYTVDSGHDDYFLHATLENPNTPANNSIPSNSSISWYTTGMPNCSQTTYDYCVGPK
jgi:prepilin-type N-terminal cleavage/methylation domain-containing protein